MESATEIALCNAERHLDRIATSLETIVSAQQVASEKNMDQVMAEAMDSFAKANPVFGEALEEMKKLHTRGQKPHALRHS